MKKYLIMGIIAFSLMITTVYAFNNKSENNNFLNNQTSNNQNCPYCNNSDCPYQNNGKDCPYYPERTSAHNCPNNNCSCQYNYGKSNSYRRQGRCHHNQ